MKFKPFRRDYIDLFELIHSLKKDISDMATTVQEAIDQLTKDVADETTANEGAISLINGFAAQLAAAVAAASAAGATAAQLQSFNDMSIAIEKNTNALASAVTSVPPAA